MKSLTQYQIDAFTSAVFSGNPAAVICLPEFLDAPLMQAIAMENNLSETAFIVPRAGEAFAYDLRWFTPFAEIEFCGHATLAAAHALAAHIDGPDTAPSTYIFHTQLGRLSVDVKVGLGNTQTLYTLVAPLLPAKPCPITSPMREAFLIPLSAAFLAGPNLYLVAREPSLVEDFVPRPEKIAPLSAHGVGLTAKGGRQDRDGNFADCTSRFFVPEMGINEDPVTGSAHTAIGPYWAQQLGKTQIRAYQASARGGWLLIDVKASNVHVSGPAKTFSISQIYLPA